MPKNELSRIDAEIPSLHPGLPTAPEAFMRTEYEGWLEEKVKRFQLRSYQRTQAERIAVLQHINRLQTECIALARNQANWRHLEQEDRIRQKRLDLEELELSHRMADVLQKREDQRVDRAKASAPPPPAPKPVDPVEEIMRSLERAIRMEASVGEVFAKARKEHPHLSEWLDEWEARVRWDLRERKWY